MYAKQMVINNHSVVIMTTLVFVIHNSSVFLWPKIFKHFFMKLSV